MISPQPIYQGPRLSPRMGYMPGANRFGYTAHIGMGMMGAISGGMALVAQNAGYDPGDIASLSAAGATDQEIIDLLEGNTNIQDLWSQYGLNGAPATASSPSISTSLQAIANYTGVSISNLQALINAGADDDDLANLVDGNTSAQTLASSYGVSLVAAGSTTTPATATPATASTAQSPSGSTLYFQVTYNSLAAFTTAASVIAGLSPLLPAYGMSIQASTIVNSGLINTTGNFQIQVLDSVGHNLISDAQSVIQSLLTTNLGSNANVQVSFLSINRAAAGGSQVPTVPASAAATSTASTTTTAATSTSFTTWLENNALLVGLGAFAIVIAAGYLKQK
jgi:hypothetical protein